MRLPKDVVTVRKCLELDRSDDLYEIANKLIGNSPELIGMWRSLERRKIGDLEHWVWSFLGAAVDASNLPPFHYKSLKARRELSDRIATLAKNLSSELEQNELDGHLIYSDGKIFNGFFLYEDFGESNQARIDADQCKKLPVSTVIQRISDRAVEKIENEPMPGKVGANVRAIRFVRIVAERNKRMYGDPLNAVIATAVNAIFEKSYEESDIAQPLAFAMCGSDPS